MSASGGRALRDLRFLYGSASPASQGFGGRAVLKLKQGAIFAGLFRFRPDEPEREANLARSPACS